MADTLDRAGMEWDTGSTNDDDRVLHTTDVSSQSPSAPVDHLSKKKRLKQKAKVLLHVSPKHSENVESVDPVTLAPTPKAAAMPYRLGTDSPMEGLDGLKDFCHQPVETIKAKAGRRSNRELAANLVTQEVTHAHDVELVHAQDHLASAKTEKERLSACSDLEALKKARQDMFVRWTMDRHVSKIRKLERKPIPHQAMGEFIIKDKPGKDKMNWRGYGHHLVLQYSEKYGGQYIGSFAEPPPASQETVSASIERLIVATTPWQQGIMNIRRIYRWESTKETSTYLAIFLFLWAVNLVSPAIFLAIIVQVLRRRRNAQTVEKLRGDIMRTEDPTVTAATLTEQIEKRGEHGWIEPLIEAMGTWMLMQLGDMASLLEVILNFYEWRQPVRTACTLSVFAAFFLAFSLTPVWLLVKTITLSAGLVFFGLSPIGSRYPDYRLLASPAKWLFWNIPNHAEWAIARLQVEALRQKSTADPGKKREGLQELKKAPSLPRDREPSSDPTWAADTESVVSKHGSYMCTDGKRSGRLHVTSVGVRFETALGFRNQWEMRYENMNRVEKINRIVKVGSGQDLLFINAEDQSFTVFDVANRNEVFTQIIGYSSVQWQVVG